jgi:hypothetical protein
MDGRKYWRKEIFPHYKQNRKQAHEKSKMDWDKFFILFNQIKNEIKELPFKTLEVESCEADDVIAVLSKLLCPHVKDLIIVSSDKDLIQIQQNICQKVKQWSPYHKKFITPETNDYSLFDHILRGDSGDGIPNILTDDDVFVTENKRSRPLRETKIIEWKTKGGINSPENFCPDLDTLNRYHRNRTLIDLEQIPQTITEKIKTSYDECNIKKADLFGYLVKNKLRKILEQGMF